MPCGNFLAAPEVFQKKVFVFEGMARVFTVFDDILIVSKGDTPKIAAQLHDERLM